MTANIVLDGPEDWINWVDVYFRILDFSTVSRVILGAIARSTRRIRVIPWTAHVQNADAAPDGGNQAWRDATPAGQPVRYASDDPHLPGDQTGLPIPGIGHGTGHGSNAILRFTPGVFMACGGGSGENADEVLLHELVHALREMRGLLNNRHMGGGFATHEEFLAVVVQSVYQDSRGRPVRASHEGFQTGQSTVTTLVHDRPDERALIRQFAAQMPDVAGQLAAIATPSYNPFRWNAHPETRPVRLGTW